jgi:putative membrane protein
VHNRASNTDEVGVGVKVMRVDGKRNARKSLWAPLMAIMLCPSFAFAHSVPGSEAFSWYEWPITPGITLMTVLTVAFYLNGIRRRISGQVTVSATQCASFLLGVLAVYLSIQSPVDVLAERVFYIHQIQHILLRALGPVLIILGTPLPAMVRGIPSSLKGKTLTPIVRSVPVQKLYAFLIHPAVASFMFIAVLYIWQIPSLHNLALEDRTVHDAMHISLLVTGLFFWWLMLDPRPSQGHLSVGTRIVVVAAIIVPNSILGAVIFFYTDVLYTGYDQLHGTWGISALTDQQIGGLIMWIPGAMMNVIVALVLLRRWIHMRPRQPVRQVA